jgi:carbohydrate-binding DOMON domain-containing protein
MPTPYRLVQSEKTASGGCSAGQGSSEPVAPRIFIYSDFKDVFTSDGKVLFC